LSRVAGEVFNMIGLWLPRSHYMPTITSNYQNTDQSDSASVKTIPHWQKIQCAIQANFIHSFIKNSYTLDGRWKGTRPSCGLQTIVWSSAADRANFITVGFLLQVTILEGNARFSCNRDIGMINKTWNHWKRARVNALRWGQGPKRNNYTNLSHFTTCSPSSKPSKVYELIM
jgi:hypothetical protein